VGKGSGDETSRLPLPRGSSPPINKNQPHVCSLCDNLGPPPVMCPTTRVRRTHNAPLVRDGRKTSHKLLGHAGKINLFGTRGWARNFFPTRPTALGMGLWECCLRLTVGMLLGAVWLRGYPQMVSGSHRKCGCQTFGLGMGGDGDNQIPRIFARNGGSAHPAKSRG
jgi:hypothetical protein